MKAAETLNQAAKREADSASLTRAITAIGGGAALVAAIPIGIPALILGIAACTVTQVALRSRETDKQNIAEETAESVSVAKRNLDDYKSELSQTFQHFDDVSNCHTVASAQMDDSAAKLNSLKRLQKSTAQAVEKLRILTNLLKSLCNSITVLSDDLAYESSISRICDSFREIAEACESFKFVEFPAINVIMEDTSQTILMHITEIEFNLMCLSEHRTAALPY